MENEIIMKEVKKIGYRVMGSLILPLFSHLYLTVIPGCFKNPLGPGGKIECQKLCKLLKLLRWSLGFVTGGSEVFGKERMTEGMQWNRKNISF